MITNALCFFFGHRVRFEGLFLSCCRCDFKTVSSYEASWIEWYSCGTDKPYGVISFKLGEWIRVPKKLVEEVEDDVE